jgi:hypothetical protein
MRAAMDILHQLVIHDTVRLVKLNPVNDFIGKAA